MPSPTRKPLIIAGAPLLKTTGGTALCRILGLAPSQLREYFALATLADAPGVVASRKRAPPVYQMRTAAWALVCSRRWRTCSRVILFGREISRPFGLRRRDPYLRWIEWGHYEGRAVAVLPHPVGDSAWWRSKINRRDGVTFAREAAGLPLGDLQGALEIGVAED